jgi:hypothetical protein
MNRPNLAPASRGISVPGSGDPRWRVAAILLTYVMLGITVLGFNRSPTQVATTVATAVLLDLLLHRVVRGGPPLFPLSAFITGLGLSILVNYAHGPWLAAVPPMFAIGSKYLFTFRGRHVYNPALFGLVACLLLGGGLISESPAYQWGGSYAIALFIVTLALFLFVLKINRVALVLSFLVFYAVSVLVRAWLTRWHMPMETWLLGAASSPSLYLFTFAKGASAAGVGDRDHRLRAEPAREPVHAVLRRVHLRHVPLPVVPRAGRARRRRCLVGAVAGAARTAHRARRCWRAGVVRHPGTGSGRQERPARIHADGGERPGHWNRIAPRPRAAIGRPPDRQRREVVAVGG